MHLIKNNKKTVENFKKIVMLEKKTVKNIKTAIKPYK